MPYEKKSINYWEAGKLGSSPWGYIDEVTQIERGLCDIQTPGHGGYRVAKRYAEKHLSQAARKASIFDGSYYWFEEDCQARIVEWELADMFAEYFNHVGVMEYLGDGKWSDPIRTWTADKVKQHIIGNIKAYNQEYLDEVA